jgi:ATP-dependent RNA helicase DeaD
MKNEFENLLSQTCTALNDMNITRYTDVQRAVIPHAMNHEDILAQAATSSGKTLAYLIPVLQDLQLQGKKKHKPAVLILCPTRELCMQTAEVIRSMLKKREGFRTAILCGGVSMDAQIRTCRNGEDIVVGTPARVIDHLRRHTFKPILCRTLVLDEADEMLSMGFKEDVETVIASLPEHQTMMFSATFNTDVEELAGKILNNPFTVHIKDEHLLKQKIDYNEIIVHEHDKPDILMNLLSKSKGQTIVFTNTRRTCDFVSQFLDKRDMQAASIHSEMDFKLRKEIMQSFRDQHLPILLATDVAARGIDIPSVETVILYDLPDTQESLIHRTGRTARAGNSGTAYIFVLPEEKNRFKLNDMFEGISLKTFHSPSHTGNTKKRYHAGSNKR